MTLTFFHTAPGNAAMLEALATEMAPEVSVKHVFGPELLDEAVKAGSMSEDLQHRISDRLLKETLQADIVVLTCSTVGAAAEAVSLTTSAPVQRIDKAMAEAAVAAGPRILVAACLESTVRPTCDLIQSVATAQNKQVHLDVILLTEAWPILQAGSPEGYVQAIADGLRPKADQADVIVLAQASMAKAEQLLADLPIPVLSSPRLGVAAAIRQLRNTPR